MEQTNEPGPADGQAKREQATHDNIEKSYQDLLKKDQEAMEAKLRGDATTRFDEVRQLGFATEKDIDRKIEGIFGKFTEEVKNLRDENTKLREWVMRAKAQGLNSGATEESPQENNMMKKWRKTW